METKGWKFALLRETVSQPSHRDPHGDVKKKEERAQLLKDSTWKRSMSYANFFF